MDAEFVFGHAGGNVFVGMGGHVRIHAEAHGSHFAFLGGQVGQHVQLDYGFHIEAANSCIQAQVNLPIGLSYACIEDVLGGEAGIEGSLHLTAAHTVCSKAEAGNVAKDYGIVIGLDGIVDLCGRPVQHF